MVSAGQPALGAGDLSWGTAEAGEPSRKCIWLYV